MFEKFFNFIFDKKTVKNADTNFCVAVKEKTDKFNELSNAVQEKRRINLKENVMLPVEFEALFASLKGLNVQERKTV